MRGFVDVGQNRISSFEAAENGLKVIEVEPFNGVVNNSF
jgi:hypothetical protein